MCEDGDGDDVVEKHRHDQRSPVVAQTTSTQGPCASSAVPPTRATVSADGRIERFAEEQLREHRRRGQQTNAGCSFDEWRS